MKSTRPEFTPLSLFKRVHGIFKQHAQDKPGKYKISTPDCLMSALAMFSLKYPSLLQFEQARKDEPAVRNNLKNLYGIEDVPCDTYMRERLDGLPLSLVRSAVSSIFRLLQRSKGLEKWKFIDNYYLVSLDGTGFFSSKSVHCEYCCEKIYKKDTEEEYKMYHHQMVVGSVVHPDMRQVLPIGFEPVVKGDGDKKNDCERNASKRWLSEFRRVHPHLDVIIVYDGLASNEPFIKICESYRFKYIFGAKESDHKALYEYFWAGEQPDVTDFTIIENGITKRYRFMDNVPLNDSNPDRLLTVVHYEETNKKNEKTTWTWVTNLEVTMKNIKEIVKGARARFKIENETFNTLKNQDYNYEHNYGHGYNTLSNLFAGLMLLAFLVDQCLEAFNTEFKAALKKCVSRIRLWKKIQAFFYCFRINSWDALYGAILDPPIPEL